MDQTNLHNALDELFDTDEIPHFDIAHADNVLSFGADWIENWISPAQYGHALGEFRSGNRGFAHVEPRFFINFCQFEHMDVALIQELNLMCSFNL